MASMRKSRLDKSKLSVLRNKNTELSKEDLIVLGDEIVSSTIEGFTEELNKNPKLEKLAKSNLAAIKEFFIGFKEGVDAEFQKYAETVNAPLETLANLEKGRQPDTPLFAGPPQRVPVGQPTPRNPLDEVLNRKPVFVQPKDTFTGKAKDFGVSVLGDLFGLDEFSKRIIEERQKKQAFVETEQKLRPGASRKELERDYEQITKAEKELTTLTENESKLKQQGYSSDQIEKILDLTNKQTEILQILQRTDTSRIPSDTPLPAGLQEELQNEQALYNEKMLDEQEDQSELLKEIRDLLKTPPKKSSLGGMTAGPSIVAPQLPDIPDILDIPDGDDKEKKDKKDKKDDKGKKDKKDKTKKPTTSRPTTPGTPGSGTPSQKVPTPTTSRPGTSILTKAAPAFKAVARVAPWLSAGVSAYGGISDLAAGKKVETLNDILPQEFNYLNPFDYLSLLTDVPMRGGMYVGDKINKGYGAVSEALGGSGSLGGDIYEGVQGVKNFLGFGTPKIEAGKGVFAKDLSEYSDTKVTKSQESVDVNFSESSFVTKDPTNFAKYQDVKNKKYKELVAAGEDKQIAEREAKVYAAKQFKKEIETSGAGTVSVKSSTQSPQPTATPKPPDVPFDSTTVAGATGEFVVPEPVEKKEVNAIAASDLTDPEAAMFESAKQEKAFREQKNKPAIAPAGVSADGKGKLIDPDQEMGFVKPETDVKIAATQRDYTLIAGEPVIPGKPLSEKQMIVIGMAKSSGKTYSPEIEKQYESQIKSSSPTPSELRKESPVKSELDRRIEEKLATYTEAQRNDISIQNDAREEAIMEMKAEGKANPDVTFRKAGKQATPITPTTSQPTELRKEAPGVYKEVPKTKLQQGLEAQQQVTTLDKERKVATEKMVAEFGPLEVIGKKEDAFGDLVEVKGYKDPEKQKAYQEMLAKTDSRKANREAIQTMSSLDFTSQRQEQLAKQLGISSSKLDSRTEGNVITSINGQEVPTSMLTDYEIERANSARKMRALNEGVSEDKIKLLKRSEGEVAPTFDFNKPVSPQQSTTTSTPSAKESLVAPVTPSSTKSELDRRIEEKLATYPEAMRNDISVINDAREEAQMEMKAEGKKPSLAPPSPIISSTPNTPEQPTQRLKFVVTAKKIQKADDGFTVDPSMEETPIRNKDNVLIGKQTLEGTIARPGYEDELKAIQGNPKIMPQPRNTTINEKPISFKTGKEVSQTLASAPVDPSLSEAASAMGKNIVVSVPAPNVVVPPQKQTVMPQPFTNNVRNRDDSISGFIKSRYSF